MSSAAGRKPAIAATIEGDGPPALLIHGQPGSAADWAGVRSRLARRFRVITPDRPGYGRTGGRAIGLVDNADAVASLLEDLDAERVVVAGHSWGAGVALALAARHSRRVRRLVLVGPITPLDPVGPIDRLLATAGAGATITRAGFWLAGTGLANRRLRSRLRAALPGFDENELAALARAWRANGVWRSFHREQRALVDELPSLADAVSALAVPTTVVIGAGDRITSVAGARNLAHALGARLVELPRFGHMVPMQAPELVAELIAVG